MDKFLRKNVKHVQPTVLFTSVKCLVPLTSLLVLTVGPSLFSVWASTIGSGGGESFRGLSIGLP